MSHLSRSLLFLAALAVAAVSVDAQPRPVAVDGAAPERLTGLVSALAFRANDHPDSIASTARRWYAAIGYLHASVRAVDTTTSQVHVILEEGPPALAGVVDILGLSEAEVDELRPTLELRPGARFTPGLLELDIAAILAYAGRTGRLLATVVVERLDDDDSAGICRVAAGLRVDAGPALTISAIRVVGNTATTSATVRRASGLREGQWWTPRAAADAVRRLQRTRLFTSVNEPAVELDERRQAVITLPVTEGRQSAFDGMIGYLPPTTGTARGTVTGLADIRLGNLLGTARRLNLRWYQERQGTQEIVLGYREPWILSSEIAVDLQFHRRQQDSLYVRQRFGVGASGPLDETMTVGASFAQSSTTPNQGYGASVMTASDEVLVGLQFAYDSRDDEVTPRSGGLYATEVQSGRKRATGPGGQLRTTVRRLRFDLGYAVSLWAGQVTLAEAHGSDVRSGAIDAADLSRLGGATTLRGYREGEFLGSRLLWGTLEHRFFLSPRSFFGAFIDVGFVRRDALPQIGLSATELVRFGYGVTIRVDAPVGLLGISIGLGEGDGFGEAKLHVRVQTEF